jgi:hypothetical protein
MGHDLVAEKVEIDPFGGRSALFATQQLTVKRACFGKIADREGEVEAGVGS